MAILSECPNCAKKYNVPDRLLGQKVRCRNCGMTFPLGGDGSVQDTSSDLQSLADVADLEPVHPPTRSAKSATGAGSVVVPEMPSFVGDTDSEFQAAFSQQDVTAPLRRQNNPFRYPLSRELDSSLPLSLPIIALGWLTLAAFSHNESGAGWVPLLRVLLLAFGFLAFMLPVGWVAIKQASKLARFDLPPQPMRRATAAFALGFTIAAVIWMSQRSFGDAVPGLIFGTIVALGGIWLLIRIEPAESAITLGLSGLAFIICCIATAGLMLLCNIGFKALAAHGPPNGELAKLTESPVGPGLDWLAPPAPAVKKADDSLEKMFATLDAADETADAAAADPSDKSKPATQATPSAASTDAAGAASVGAAAASVAPGGSAVAPAVSSGVAGQAPALQTGAAKVNEDVDPLAGSKLFGSAGPQSTPPTPADDCAPCTPAAPAAQPAAAATPPQAPAVTGAPRTPGAPTPPKGATPGNPSPSNPTAVATNNPPSSALPPAGSSPTAHPPTAQPPAAATPGATTPGAMTAGHANLIASVREVVETGTFQRVEPPLLPGPVTLLVKADTEPTVDRLEVWNVERVQMLSSLSVRRDGGKGVALDGNLPSYAVSPDASAWARIVSFPTPSVEVTSLSGNTPPVHMPLKDDFGTASVLGFLSPERLLVRRRNNQQVKLEIWNAKTALQEFKRDLPNHPSSPGNGVVSPDGKFYAIIGTTEPKPGAAPLVQLKVYDLSPRGGWKTSPAITLAADQALQPTGMAFSPDMHRLSILYEQSGNTVLWNYRLPALTPAPVQPIAAGKVRAPNANAFDRLTPMPGGKAWLVGGQAIVDAESGVLLDQMEVAHPVAAQSSTADGILLLSGQSNQWHLYLVKPASEGPAKQPAPAAGPSPRATAVAPSPAPHVATPHDSPAHLSPAAVTPQTSNISSPARAH